MGTISRIAAWASLIALLFLGTCAELDEPERTAPIIGFYHWEQQLIADSLNHCLLETTQCTSLHVKLFDVVWANGQAEPRAVLQIEGDSLKYDIIPTVFLTNEVFEQIPEEALRKLAIDILQLGEAILGHQTPIEWQFDCDWTQRTSDRYFSFLRAIRNELSPTTSLSATVRLHQYKDYSIQGVPPVDRGLLMAYNVGTLRRWETTNSILDTTITADYLRPGVNYPLSLDIGMPLYQWGVVYRSGSLTYLINELSAKALSDTSRFALLEPNRYQALQSTYLGTYYLYQGDQLRLEAPDSVALSTLARQMRVVPSFAGQRLLFYRLGSQAASQCPAYQLKELVKILGPS